MGIIDTDCDPDTVDVVIPANDDSIRAISLLLNELAEAVATGKTMDTIRKDVAAEAQACAAEENGACQGGQAGDGAGGGRTDKGDQQNQGGTDGR